MPPSPASPSLTQAAALLSSGDVEAAAAQYNAVLAVTPDNVPALIGLAVCARKRQDRAAALDFYRTAARLAPNNPGLLNDLADELRGFRRHQEAEALYLRAIELNKGLISARLGLIDCLRQRGAIDEAMVYAREVVELRPEDAARLMDAADLMRGMKAFDEAERIYLRVAALLPHSPMPRAALAECARQRGDYATSLFRHQALAQLEPGQIRWRLNVAEDLRVLGRFAEAVEAFRPILEMEPQNAMAAGGLGYCLARRGDYAGALHWLHRAAELQPDAPRWQLDIADELRTLGRHDEEEAILRRVLASHPDERRVLAGLIACSRVRYGHQAAATLCESFLQNGKHTDFVRLELGTALRELGRTDEAKAQYRAVLAKLPESVEALMGLGYCDRQQGNRKAALEWFRTAAAINPRLIRPALEQSVELREMGDTGTARDIANALYAAHPDNHTVILNLAELERHLLRRTEARALYQQALVLQPNNPDILVDLAGEDRALGMLEDCARHLTEALAVNPSHRGAIINAAGLSHGMGDHERALTLYQKAIETRSGDVDMHTGLANALNLLGRGSEAVAYLASLEATFGVLPQLRLMRIMLLRQTGHLFEALHLAREVAPKMTGQFTLMHEWFLCEIMVGDPAGVARALAALAPATMREKALRLACFGMSYENVLQLDTARRFYEAALHLAPNDIGTQNSLTRVLMIEGDVDGAFASLRMVAELDTPSRRLSGLSTNVSQSLFGQILDEYRIDRQVAEQIKHLQLRPPARRAAALLELLAANPDNTGVAVALLIAMQQSGALRLVAGAGPGIPHRIVQFWDNTPPPEIVDMMASWQIQNPDYEILLFNDATAQTYIEGHFPRPVLDAYLRSKEPAQKADLFRLAYLLREGGVYADADDRCLCPLAGLLTPQMRFVVHQEDLGTVGNNFIATAPGHPVLIRALRDVVEAINRGDSDLLWLSTGPGLLTRALAAQIMESGRHDSLPAGITVMHRRELYQTVAMHSFVGYKRSKKHWAAGSFSNRVAKLTGW